MAEAARAIRRVTSGVLHPSLDILLPRYTKSFTDFTVFAPTDEAFRKLPDGALEALLKDSAKLKAVLNFHVITGHVSARDMKTGEVMTLQGSPPTAVVSSSEVKINGAHMKGADMIATNGVVHAIDAVIMPRNWQLLAAAA